MDKAITIKQILIGDELYLYRAVRVDEWTSEDDLILAEITLRHIRECSSLKAAYEECGERIGRTSIACSARWNNNVKHRFQAALSIARQQAEKRRNNKKVTK